MNHSLSNRFPLPNDTPELELLVCLARTTLDSAHTVKAGDLMRGMLDWDRFLGLAWRHGLMPLVFSHLLNSFAELVPAEHLQRVRDDFQHNSARNLMLATELCRVIEDFEEHEITAIPYKGPALALQVYGDLKLRSFVDLDLLVLRGDASRAGAVLTARGYRPHLNLTPAQESFLSRSECDRVYLREGRNIVLELHWAVAPPFFSVGIEIETVWADRARTEMCGREVSVPSPEMLLLLLCVNGAKDLWTTLEPVCTVNELIRRYPGLDWERVIRLGRRAGALRMLHVGLVLARQTFNVPLPERLLASIDADGPVKDLVDEARLRLSENEMPEPGLFEKTRFRIRSRERRRDKLRYCVLRLFTPTYKDCSPELPTSLSFLYYALRPLRLLRAGLKRPADKPVV
ncbi:MAG: nucleotidyltransferase family protein [Pyrinomonadaceae bacterium]|nr:nucleotidyltransferase family protein [Pyrinomonadaceae bacterium]